MTCNCLYYALGLRLSIPNFDSSIRRASNNKNLIKYAFSNQTFYLTFMYIGQIIKFSNLIIFTLCKFLGIEYDILYY
jgi:hypothetical protein